MKKCTKCGGDGPFNKDKHQRSGLSVACRQCERERVRKWKKENRKKFNDGRKDWARRNPEAAAAIRKNGKLKARYGLSLEDFKKMLEKQDGKCAICVQPLTLGRHTHVDHCHETGVVRGLLCDQCNLGVGYFRDNPALMVRAAEYVTTRRKAA